MSGITPASGAASINAVNQVLEMASQASLQQTEKLMKYSVEMAVKSPGKEIDKGLNFDGSA
jgi:hypothetical protein